MKPVLNLKLRQGPEVAARCINLKIRPVVQSGSLVVYLLMLGLIQIGKRKIDVSVSNIQTYGLDSSCNRTVNP